MLQGVGAVSRYALCGGASVAAYDCAVNDGSAVSQIVKLVTSASSPLDKLQLTAMPAAPAAPIISPDVSELSAKLDRLTTLSLTRLQPQSSLRPSVSFALCTAGVVVGGLAAWAVFTGRWWPTVQKQLEEVVASVVAVDAKIDARADQIVSQLSVQHDELKADIAAVAGSVRRLEASHVETKAEVAEVATVARENNRGIHILCEVVASNFDLRHCPSATLKKLHDFSGAEAPAQAQLTGGPGPERSLQGPSDAAPAPQPSLMQYLTTPAAGPSR